MAENLDIPGRLAVRTPMQWTGGANGGFSKAPKRRLTRPLPDGLYGPERVNAADQRHDHQSFWWFMRDLIYTYRQQPEIGWSTVGSSSSPTPRSWLTCAGEESGWAMVALHNFGAEPASCPSSSRTCRRARPRRPARRATEHELDADGRVELGLEPYGYRWLRVRRPEDEPIICAPDEGDIRIGGSRWSDRGPRSGTSAWRSRTSPSTRTCRPSRTSRAPCGPAAARGRDQAAGREDRRAAAHRPRAAATGRASSPTARSSAPRWRALAGARPGRAAARRPLAQRRRQAALRDAPRAAAPARELRLGRDLRHPGLQGGDGAGPPDRGPARTAGSSRSADRPRSTTTPPTSRSPACSAIRRSTSTPASRPRARRLGGAVRPAAWRSAREPRRRRSRGAGGDPGRGHRGRAGAGAGRHPGRARRRDPAQCARRPLPARRDGKELLATVPRTTPSGSAAATARSGRACRPSAPAVRPREPAGCRPPPEETRHGAPHPRPAQQDLPVARQAAVLAVDKVDLAASDGEIVALLGSSGCGKTSTLRMIAGFEDVTSGSIRVGDRPIQPSRPRSAASPWRSRATRSTRR